MMSIAQKCSLNMSSLPSTLEPSLMDEPCDWDVCTEASTPGHLSQLSSKTEKKKRAKPLPNQEQVHVSPRNTEKHNPSPRPDIERKPREVPVVPSHEELQETLPKIPSLSSFKTCKSRFMTFEEAKRDFESFITVGLGRSVEIIREFRGREDGGTEDQNGHSESVMLHDDGAQRLKLNRTQIKSECLYSKSASGSASSESDTEDETTGRCTIIKPGLEAKNTLTVSKTKVASTKTEISKSSSSETLNQTTKTRAFSLPAETYKHSSAVKSSRRPNQTTPSHTNKPRKTEKKSKRVSEDSNREQRSEMEDEEHGIEVEQGEWRAENYWRSCYRAWNDYYSSMSPFQEGGEGGYQSYYSVAHNWMAAYRMNAVYMEELMKD